jgi:two-component system LytT family response regulator
MSKIKIVIVDDEPLAREVIKGYLGFRDDIEIVAECENGFDCIKLLANEAVDILFLDIQMPKIDGFEMLEVIEQHPEVIFSTAFDQYAIKAFEQNAIDYLLKPYSKERFDTALEKAIARVQQQESSHVNLRQIEREEKVIERIIVRNGSKIILVPVDDIFYLEADDDYVLIHTKNGRYIKDQTMKYFENNLPKRQFLRVHRGFIANINAIKSIEAYSKDSYMALMENNEKIKISPDGYRKIKEMS